VAPNPARIDASWTARSISASVGVREAVGLGGADRLPVGPTPDCPTRDRGLHGGPRDSPWHGARRPRPTCRDLRLRRASTARSPATITSAGTSGGVPRSPGRPDPAQCPVRLPEVVPVVRIRLDEERMRPRGSADAVGSRHPHAHRLRAEHPSSWPGKVRPARHPHHRGQGGDGSPGRRRPPGARGPERAAGDVGGDRGGDGSGRPDARAVRSRRFSGTCRRRSGAGRRTRSRSRLHHGPGRPGTPGGRPPAVLSIPIAGDRRPVASLDPAKINTLARSPRRCPVEPDADLSDEAVRSLVVDRDRKNDRACLVVRDLVLAMRRAARRDLDDGAT
jgi:hypothetical protein